MNEVETKQAIINALKNVGTGSLADAAMALLRALGYQSQKHFPLNPNTPDNFQATFAQNYPFNPERALFKEWDSVDFLFQVTDEEIRTAAGAKQQLLFDSKGIWDGAVIDSYLFFVIQLRKPRYTRTELSGIARAVNRLFLMPVMLLFRHGDSLSLAIVRRRLHKRDESRDVLEKVTLIKDIRFDDPLRAHIDILSDLSLPSLYEEFDFHNFVGLHAALEKRLDTYALNKSFYREVANWYFWALQHPGVVLPRSIAAIRNVTEREKQRAIFFIRLLTRLIFCWFLQEKGLIPRDLFRRRVVNQMLKDTSPSAGTYYRAFLQNLFFATLNQECDKRDWRKKYPGSRDGNRGITNLYRYTDLFNDPDAFLSLVKNGIPFVNGGLFDCLDEVYDEKDKANVRLDDFSEERANKICLPNELFFSEEQEKDLTDFYRDPKDKGTRRVIEGVRGLIDILDRYKFTVEENTPLEQEIALDPELLGEVFENLLASYNEDTRTTARKALGGYYTPREIVHYMVDESINAYLENALNSKKSSVRLSETPPSQNEQRFRSLFTSSPHNFQNPFTSAETDALISAIDHVKILDPACGSGAFPMGALQRLVDLLQKLDPNNSRWKQQQLAKAEAYLEMLRQANVPKAELAEVEARIDDIRQSFDTRFHALDFARKLYLIENCIYGVDVQPIACQIAKLRFFIALLVDQNVDPKADNLGVRPLPNLETKIVAADTLVSINKPSEEQFDLVDLRIPSLRRDLERVRHDHFNARTPARKARCRERDAQLRNQIAVLLQKNGMPAVSARALAAWNPYDQNHAAEFFDPEWMFGLPIGKVRMYDRPTLLGNLALINQVAGQMELNESREIESGFDIVIGNPPYVRIQTLKQQNAQQARFLKDHYESAKKGNYDLYVVFVERGLQLLRLGGTLAYILPHKFFNAQYGEPLRALLAKGRHVKHVVHFGDQQVFPGTTNYVCLLFLVQGGADDCRFVRADNLSAWLQTYSGIESKFSAEAISASEWNFSFGRGSNVIEQLQAMPGKLGNIASIFVGLQTSADRIYVFRNLDHSASGLIKVESRDGSVWELERKILRPFLLDASLEPFGTPKSNHWLLFPYEVRDKNAALLSARKMVSEFPKAWAYLNHHSNDLRAREGDKWDHKEWYAFGRNQSLKQMEAPKLIVQVLAQSPRFALDEASLYFTGGGNGPYYGVRWLAADDSRSLKYLQAVLNSRVSDYFVRQVSTPFRGSYWSYGKRFIEQFPVASASVAQQSLIVRLVNYLLWLHRYLAAHPTERTPCEVLMFGWWEKMLNGLVYELYFSDELSVRGLSLFDLMANDAILADLTSIPESDRMSHLRQRFKKLYDSRHPVYDALHTLRSLETIRVIEGAP